MEMRLELHKVHITGLSFAEKTYVNGGTLCINKSEAEAVIEEVDDLVTRHHLDTTAGQVVFKITGNYYKPINREGKHDEGLHSRHDSA